MESTDLFDMLLFITPGGDTGQIGETLNVITLLF